MIRILALLLLAPLLGGCLHTSGGGSVAGGACKIFDAPKFEVRGATQHDQDWIDPTIESGVGGCKWARPARRPPQWDAAPAPKVVVAKPAKKPGLLKRIKARVWPKAAAPVAHLTETAPRPITAPPASMMLPAPAVPMAKPRTALDELLFPAKR